MLLTPQGRGVIQQSFLREAPPRGPTSYIFIHIFARKSTPFIDKWYPSDIPSLELHIAFKCWKCTLFKIRINLKQERFLDFFTAIKCICQSFRPFNAPKWQISLPFHTLSKQRHYHVMERRSVTSRYHGSKISGFLSLRWRYTKRFATTIFSATRFCNVGTVLQSFATMFQRCFALKIVVANCPA